MLSYQNPPQLDSFWFCHNIQYVEYAVYYTVCRVCSIYSICSKYSKYNLPTTRVFVMLGKGLDDWDWITVKEKGHICSMIHLWICEIISFLFLYFFISNCWASYLVGWEWIIVGGRSPQNYSLGDKYIDLQLPCSSQILPTFPSIHLICHLPLFYFFFHFIFFFCWNIWSISNFDSWQYSFLLAV